LESAKRYLEDAFSEHKILEKQMQKAMDESVKRKRDMVASKMVKEIGQMQKSVKTGEAVNLAPSDY
jgi:vacuolar-type H+-ATPase subunit H